MEIPEPRLPEGIESFLKAMHFQPHSILSGTPTWVIRGVHPKYKEEVVIKVATASRDSMRLRNHSLWTKSLTRKMPKHPNFHIATVLENGNEGALHWCLMPYIKGTPLAQFKGGITEVSGPLVEAVLPRIVALLQFIERNSALSVAGLDGRFGSISKKDKLSLLQTAIEWARPSTPHLAELLQVINANYRYLGVANSHGDFTETNIIVNSKNEPVLIDADISDAFNYKYYDVAEFYNRLYTRACDPELARKFIAIYCSSLPKQTTNKFLNNFLCLSALRCIGDFMEVASLKTEKGKGKRLEYTTRYAEDIVSHNILLIS